MDKDVAQITGRGHLCRRTQKYPFPLKRVQQQNFWMQGIVKENQNKSIYLSRFTKQVSAGNSVTGKVKDRCFPINQL